jgi:hypothetical protein
MRSMPTVIILCGLVFSAAATAARPSWQLAGKTFNSVAFVDMNSIVGDGTLKDFTAIRVSGQPASDGWTSVVQKLQVNCDTRLFFDGGSRIEQSNGTFISYPGSGASQKAVTRGVFFDMFEIVCAGRRGASVANPKEWTLKNFRPGE